MTADELRKAQRDYARTKARAERLRRERNALLLRAAEEGWTQAELVRATGISRARVVQLTKP